MSRAALPRWYGWALLALTGAGLWLRLAGLEGQPLIPDDQSVASTALNYGLAGWPGPTMWNHPRLRDLLVAASLGALGDGPLALKLWSVLLGALSVPAVAWLVSTAGGGPLAALAAAAVVGTDPLHLDFSRQAINDVYLACLAPAAVAAAWRYRDGRQPGWLLAAGTLLALGLASKHAIAFPVLVVVVVLAVEAARSPLGRGGWATELAFGVACLAILPLTFYLATAWPWLARGHDLGEWLRFQVTAARETATHVGYPGSKFPDYANEVVGAWRWFLQPIWYVDSALVGAVEAGGLSWTLVVGVGNPVTWLLVWPAALLAAWRWRRDGHGASGLLLCLFLASYLPFALARRPIWTNSALAVLPFSAALLGLAAAWAWERRPRLVAGWATLALAAAAVLWAPAAGRAIGPSTWVVERLVPPIALTPREELLPTAPAGPLAPGSVR